MRKWLFAIPIVLIIVAVWQFNAGETPATVQSVADSTTQLAQIDSMPAPEFREVRTPQVEIDLSDIRKRGKLVALTGYSANSYFVYKGEPMGFEYELLKLLAKHLNVELEIVIVRNLDRIFSLLPPDLATELRGLLNEGAGDIIAYNVTITKKRLEYMAFSDPHTLIHQVLVQRMPANWRDLKQHEIDKMLLSNVTELIGKQVYVRKGSSYYQRLQNLSDEVGGDIEIVEVPGDISTDELIARVSNGEIDYTVADVNVAQINAGYHSNIDIRVPISLPQRLAWAVRKNSPELTREINSWIKEIKQQPTYNVLYDKYHRNKRFYTQRVKSEFFSLTGDKISPYDDEIKVQANGLGWDWRLLASQIYQESQFDPNATSWAGARGLMQLMPATARQFGAKKILDPAQNIAAGSRYLRWLANYWKEIPDSLQRMKFILASYNAGQGHVEDARKLAVKYGKDPNIWDENVAEFMLKKAQEKYFNDEVVQFGYCRGEEPMQWLLLIF